MNTYDNNKYKQMATTLIKTTAYFLIINTIICTINKYIIKPKTNIICNKNNCYNMNSYDEDTNYNIYCDICDNSTYYDRDYDYNVCYYCGHIN